MRIMWANLALLILSAGFPGHAKILLIPHPELPAQEFEYVLRQNDELQSFNDYYKTQSATEARQIAEEYSLGRIAELSGDIDKATTHYQMIFRLYPKLHQLPKSLEKIVLGSLQSLLRHSSSTTQNSFWTSELHRLQYLLEPKRDVDRNDLLAHLRPENKILWRPYDQVKGFDFLSINGVFFSINEHLEIPLIPGRYRIAVLSNQYSPQSLETSADEVKSWIPETSAFLAGHCAAPKLQSAILENRRIEALYSKDCRVAFTGTHLERHLNGKGFVSDYSQPETLDLVVPKQEAPASPTHNWVMWGAAAVVTGLILHHQLKDKEVTVEWPSM